MARDAGESRPITVRSTALPPVTMASGDDLAPVSVRVVYGCPHCGHPLRIRPEYFGLALACKRCEAPFVPSLVRAVTSLPTPSRVTHRIPERPAPRRAIVG